MLEQEQTPDATAWGYRRASTEDQILTLAAQEDEILRYYELWLKPKSVKWGGFFTDSAVSGKDRFVDRPAGRELANRLRRGDHVVFSKLDRGWRNVRDLLFCVDLWDDQGVAIHMLDLRIDTSTPEGKLILVVFGALAEWERRRISERTKLGMKFSKKMKDKKWVRTPQIGQKLLGKQGHKKMVPDEYEQGIMRKIWEWKHQGHSFESIYWNLLRSGVRTRDGREWSETRVRRAYERYKEALAKMDSTNGNGLQSGPEPGSNDAPSNEERE